MRCARITRRIFKSTPSPPEGGKLLISPPAFTAYDWAEGVRSGSINPREAIQSSFDRIESIDRDIHALLGTDVEGALAQADAVAKQVSSGKNPGPLAGVPVAIKNNIAVEGWPLECGSKILEGFKSRFTATVVQRLQESGAIPIGWANLDEFAMGASGENSAFASPRNPFDKSKVPGGSSGGSAAAVAAGYCPIALGSETGGSVRQPAAFCGLFGLKPTYGRFSRWGLVAFASSLDQIGVFGRSAKDLALVFDACAGGDPRDATSLPDPPKKTENSTLPAENLRVGVLSESLHESVGPAIRKAITAAAESFRTTGAQVEECTLPYQKAVVPTYYLLTTAEASANLARFDGTRYGARANSDSLNEMVQMSRDKGFGPEVKRRILLGTFALSAGYQDEYFQAAQKARTLVVRAYAELFDKFDLLLGATTPSPAFGVGEKIDDPVAMYLCDIFTASANLAGVPAINIPAGLAGKLPLGIQLTAAQRGEHLLIAAASHLESTLGGSPLATADT